MVFETSQGVKNNIIRTLTRYGKAYVEKLNGNSAKIFFVICYIQALLQERRKYIPQGKTKIFLFHIELFQMLEIVHSELWNVLRLQHSFSISPSPILCNTRK